MASRMIRRAVSPASCRSRCCSAAATSVPTISGRRWRCRCSSAPPRRPRAEAWPSEDWWRGFNSPELTALIEQARAQNFDIAAAIARVRQADAQVRIAGAPLLPNVTATAGASWQQVGATRGFTGVSRGGSTTSTIDIRDYSLTPLNVAYEVDFWGKNRAAPAVRRMPAPCSAGSTSRWSR